MFPGLTAPISAGRPGTLRAIEAALKDERLVFAVAQRDNSDEPTADILYSMGVIARIGQVQRGLGGVQLLLQGEQRATSLQYTTTEGFLQAVVVPTEEMTPLNEHDPAFEALEKETRERAAELGEKRGLPEEVVHQVLESVTEPGRFADLVAGYIDLPVAEKQGLLETLSVEERMRRVLVHVQRHIELLEAQEDIKSQVQEELGERQREMFLREQMKAIQKELGEENSSKEIQELRERLSKLTLPKEGRAEVERELGRLERSGRESMEAQVIRTYLEWIAELPWNERSNDNLDLKHATEVLDEDHYGLTDVKDRVLEFLAVRQLRAQQLAEEVDKTGEVPAEKVRAEKHEPTATLADGEDKPITDVKEAKARAMARGPILLFVGPPGVGKTSIAKSIARSLGREYVRVALGGARDEADIRGHRRTYVGAMPGRIIQGMKQAGTKNPVFLLDEVDKLGVSYQGDPSSALLEVLDPAQNDTFTDHYLNIPFDLSEVLFIATANFVQNIPGPLLDRMEMVDFAGYTEREKAEIAKKYLLPKQLEESGLNDKSIEITDEAVMSIVSNYTRESGVRQLERQIGAVARKIARKLATGEQVAHTVTAEDVRELLGRPKVHPEHIQAEDQVGVATGMYYTPMGGDIMFVEASVRRFHGNRSTDLTGDAATVVSGGGATGPVSLILTGQLGDVMKESARAAFTYATNNAAELGIPSDRLGSIEAHIHVPAGAIPKDGPSAGIAIATALVSEMSGRPVRRDVAMTGEITLRGRVLPIGGLKEKVLGAHRAGIKHIILPKANEADVEDIPDEVRGQLTFHPVETLREVLEIALEPEHRAEPDEMAHARGELAGV